jgi:hypothetical protein
MNTLHTRLLCLTAGLSLSFVFGSARALNGNTAIAYCSTCETPIDFRNAAITQSYTDQADLTYVVVGSSNGMSAYVRVSGYWFFDPYSWTEYWTVNGAQPMDQNGGALSDDLPTAQAQMSVVDVGLFGFTRGPSSPKVATVNMPTDYDGSFIGSTDEYDSPGIGRALALLGVNPAEFPIGAKLTVIYHDGTKAVFVKISNSGSYQWTWDGQHAWDSQGHPFTDRSGTLAANSNTTGYGSGSTSVSETLDAEGGAAALWFIYEQQQCTTTTTLSIDGEVVGTFSGYVPC